MQRGLAESSQLGKNSNNKKAQRVDPKDPNRLKKLKKHSENKNNSRSMDVSNDLIEIEDDGDDGEEFEGVKKSNNYLNNSNSNCSDQGETLRMLKGNKGKGIESLKELKDPKKNLQKRKSNQVSVKDTSREVLIQIDSCSSSQEAEIGKGKSEKVYGRGCEQQKVVDICEIEKEEVDDSHKIIKETVGFCDSQKSNKSIRNQINNNNSKSQKNHINYSNQTLDLDINKVADGDCGQTNNNVNGQMNKEDQQMLNITNQNSEVNQLGSNIHQDEGDDLIIQEEQPQKPTQIKKNKSGRDFKSSNKEGTQRFIKQTCLSQNRGSERYEPIDLEDEEEEEEEKAELKNQQQQLSDFNVKRKHPDEAISIDFPHSNLRNSLQPEIQQSLPSPSLSSENAPSHQTQGASSAIFPVFQPRKMFFKKEILAKSSEYEKMQIKPIEEYVKAQIAQENDDIVEITETSKNNAIQEFNTPQKANQLGIISPNKKGICLEESVEVQAVVETKKDTSFNFLDIIKEKENSFRKSKEFKNPCDSDSSSLDGSDNNSDENIINVESSSLSSSKIEEQLKDKQNNNNNNSIYSISSVSNNSFSSNSNTISESRSPRQNNQELCSKQNTLQCPFGYGTYSENMGFGNSSSRMPNRDHQSRQQVDLKGNNYGFLQKTTLQDERKQFSGGSTLWTDKYAPRNVMDCVENNGVIQKLEVWLRNWENVVVRKQKPEGNLKDNPFARACLLSGPPGIGKTTSVRIIAKKLGMHVVEWNASDVRNKAAIEAFVGPLRNNQVLNLYNQGKEKVIILMDEVDGMSSGDIGGSQCLLKLIKDTRNPIICICNDRYCQKLKPLATVSYDLRFYKPNKHAVAMRLSKICAQERVQSNIPALEFLVESLNCDIRSSINLLQSISRKFKRISMEDLQFRIMQSSKKDDQVSLNTFQAARLFLVLKESAKYNLLAKSELFFMDYELIPLLIQENYLSAAVQKPKLEMHELEGLVSASAALAESDILGNGIRANGNWMLLNDQGFLCAAYAPSKISANFTDFYPQMSQVLGKMSSARKVSRLAKELRMNISKAASVDMKAAQFDYARVLFELLIDALKTPGKSGIDRALNIMDNYNLSPDILKEHLVLLSYKNEFENILKNNISAATKGALTKAYKKRFNQDIRALKSSNKRNDSTDEENGSFIRNEDDFLDETKYEENEDEEGVGELEEEEQLVQPVKVSSNSGLGNGSGKKKAQTAKSATSFENNTFQQNGYQQRQNGQQSLAQKFNKPILSGMLAKRNAY